MKLTHVSLAICGGYVPEKFGPVNIKPYILGLYCNIPLVICGFPMFSSAQIVKIVITKSANNEDHSIFFDDFMGCFYQVCEKCHRMEHLVCLRQSSGPLPTPLLGDTFFTLLCAKCSPTGREVIKRDRVNW